MGGIKLPTTFLRLKKRGVKNAIKILIGGSPCTYWSISKQDGNREIEAAGTGWELFKNFLIAKQKFKPDLFLYENNQSASKIIKEQIQESLKNELVNIDSALVSAQSRKRFYVCNWRVSQPTNRGILLEDIIDINTSNEQTYKFGCIQSPKGQSNTPVRIGTIENKAKNKDFDSRPYRVYSPKGKSVTLVGNGGGVGAKTGLYLLPTSGKGIKDITYEIKNGYLPLGEMTADKEGLASIKTKFKTDLDDGLYCIRKLTPVECERLQTLPDGYTSCVSTANRYRGLGNGWTAEVITHILDEALRNLPKSTEIIVLSMYDGIGTGRYCINQLGFRNVKYYAYEIDKSAIMIAKTNFHDIIHLGDAFDVRK